MIKTIKVTAKALLLSMLLHQSATLAEGCCAPQNNCGPCGEIITNLPNPGYDCNRVQPFQNFLATYTDTPFSSAGYNGLYIGTGAGVGRLDLNLSILGVPLPPTVTDNYISEYFTVGYAFSYGAFFIGTELGYYYNSVTRGLFYDDPSTVVLALRGLIPIVVGLTPTTITPSTVRLDINARNHFALDLLPGFSFCRRFTLFARAGVEYTRYHWHRRLSFPFPSFIIDGPDGVTPTLIFSDLAEIEDDQSDSAVSFRLGAGLSFAVNCHLSLTANYIHKFPQTVHISPNVSLIGENVLGGQLIEAVDATFNIGSLASKNTFKPTSEEILFGIQFNF